MIFCARLDTKILDQEGAAMINIHEAKTHLSRIVEEVAAGKEVIIAKAGVPMVKIVPLSRKRAPLKYGLLKGRMRVSDDFDAPLPASVLQDFGIES
jgi:prevent-host-death family protein